MYHQSLGKWVKRIVAYEVVFSILSAFQIVYYYYTHVVVIDFGGNKKSNKPSDKLGDVNPQIEMSEVTNPDSLGQKLLQ
jgi:hypothetical protein